MKLSEKVRRRRIEKNMSATSLAKASGTSPQTILDIEEDESKNPGVWRIRAIADELELSMNWLTDESADWPPPSAERQIVDFVKDAFDRSGLSGGAAGAEEQALLADFRALPDAQRAEVRGIVRGMAMSAPAATDPDATARGQAAYDRITEAGRQADDARRGKQEDEKGAAG